MNIFLYFEFTYNAYRTSNTSRVKRFKTLDFLRSFMASKKIYSYSVFEVTKESKETLYCHYDYKLVDIND